MSIRNFIRTVCAAPLLEAQPHMIRVGCMHQGRVGGDDSRVPFIRLAGRWLSEAGFEEGDMLRVEVAPSHIRFVKQEPAGSENTAVQTDSAAPLER
jgi:Toxin SymE, type I toxin-antitoxin system